MAIKKFVIDTLAYIVMITLFNLVLNYKYHDTRPILTYIIAIVFVQLIFLFFTKRYKTKKIN